MEIIKAIIFGIVEGITEWLPVSSTGHLILFKSFMQFKDVSDGFFDMFEVVIQLGAILAVVAIYFKDIWPFSKDKSKNFKAIKVKPNSEKKGSKFFATIMNPLLKLASHLDKENVYQRLLLDCYLMMFLKNYFTIQHVLLLH